MQGIIQKAMPPAASSGAPTEVPAEEAAQAPEAQAQGKFRTNVVSALPENLREPFERVVLAGMKIMFSEEMQDDLERELAGDKPMFQKLAESVAGLMGIIYKQSKGMPPDILIPAGIELLHEGAAYINDAKLGTVSPEEVKEATQYFAVLMLHGQGVDEKQIMQAVSGGAQQEPAPEQAPEQAQGAANGLQS